MSSKSALCWGVALAAVCLFEAQPARAESVSWIDRPPAAIQGGESFVVQWEVRGFEDALVQNGIAFDQAPAPGVWDVLTPVQIARIVAREGTRTADQLDGNCLYTAVVDVPAVGTQQTFYFALFAASETENAFDTAIPVLVTPGPAAASYIVDKPGAAWTYAPSFSGFTQFTVVRNLGAEEVDCGSTTVFEDVRRGAREQFTIAPDGVLLHNAVGFVFADELEIFYEPALRLTNAELNTGDVATSSGMWTGISNGVPFLETTYTATSTVLGPEPLFVPAGVFETIHIFVDVQFGTGLTDTADIWVAKDIGVVAALTSVGFGNRILLRTNLQ